MGMVRAATAIALLAGLAACEVKVDQNLQDAVANQAEAIGNELEAAADDAGNTIDRAGDTVANEAGDLRNRVDIDVKVDGHSNQANLANSQ